MSDADDRCGSLTDGWLNKSVALGSQQETVNLVRLKKGSTLQWATLSTILLILLSLAHPILIASSHRCQLSKEVPTLRVARVVHTEPDATRIAKLAGYIQVYDLGYLTLDINHIRFDILKNRIVLEDDCVSLYYSVYKNRSGNERISSVEWTFADGNEDFIKSTYDKCDLISPIIDHLFPLAYRYWCPNRQTYKCMKKEGDGTYKPIAELVITSFELELDGDEEMISRGEFSKAPWTLSCS